MRELEKEIKNRKGKNRKGKNTICQLTNCLNTRDPQITINHIKYSNIYIPYKPIDPFICAFHQLMLVIFFLQSQSNINPWLISTVEDLLRKMNPQILKYDVRQHSYNCWPDFTCSM